MQKSAPLSLQKIIKTTIAAAVVSASFIGFSHAEVGEPEKEDLKFGFIKLTDMSSTCSGV